MVRSFLVLGPTNSEGGPVVDRGVLVCSVEHDLCFEMSSIALVLAVLSMVS